MKIKVIKEMLRSYYILFLVIIYILVWNLYCIHLSFLLICDIYILVFIYFSYKKLQTIYFQFLSKGGGGQIAYVYRVLNIYIYWKGIKFKICTSSSLKNHMINICYKTQVIRNGENFTYFVFVNSLMVCFIYILKPSKLYT